MKKTILLISLIFAIQLFISAFAFAQGPRGPMPPMFALESITVTGKIIIDTSSTRDKRYFIDINNDGTKEYQLAFGPSWYTPTTGAVKPANGETVTIKGDVFKNFTPPLISVYEINGLKWRDTLGFRFIHNPVAIDSIRKGNPWGNRFGWCVKDSFLVVNLSGKAIVDSVNTRHKIYFLDKDSDGGKDYVLSFGPNWYVPKSGATRPNNGDAITIKGGLLQRPATLTDSAINFVVVFEINGQKWVDSIGKFPWPGRKMGRNNNMTRVSSMYNGNTYCEFSDRSFGMGTMMGGLFGNMFSQNIYSSIMEIDPVYLPVDNMNIVSAFSVNVMDDGMNGLFMSFDKNIKVRLNYTNSELSEAKTRNSNLKLKYIGDNNIAIEVPFAKFDYTNKSVEFSQIVPNGVYVVEASIVTEVTKSNVIPEKVSLLQNYPNPFNPTTNISFDIPARDFVKITVYDLVGSKVKELLSNNMEAGTYNVTWDGTNANNQTVSSGIYFYKLETSTLTLTKKMHLLK